MAFVGAGYRVISGMVQNQTTLEAALLALGQDAALFTDYFEACRRKRNTLDYDYAHVVSETEAEELVHKTKGFQHLVESWITRDYPQFAR